MKLQYLACTLVLTACATSPTNKTNKKGPWTFQSAKDAAKKIFHDHRITFYCECAYDQNNRVDARGCGYTPRKNAARGKRVEWEHIVPAQAFGAHRKCWKGCDGLKGRLCCRKHDRQFKEMEADLHNLVPSVGELNGDRSSRPYGEVGGEPRIYGNCDFEIDFDRDVVEPASKLRGEIARVYLYMHKTYPGGLPLTRTELTKLRKTAKNNPPNTWEKLRWKRIGEVQRR